MMDNKSSRVSSKFDIISHVIHICCSFNSLYIKLYSIRVILSIIPHHFSLLRFLIHFYDKICYSNYQSFEIGRETRINLDTLYQQTS